mmetsp:Transcript_12279/g.19821  ORF Transcript_12279/g.19821 Transcript_12279/m.19821 type:complete len:355 (+) Transcript_12279:237-1301(+)
MIMARRFLASKFQEDILTFRQMIFKSFQRLNSLTLALITIACFALIAEFDTIGSEDQSFNHVQSSSTFEEKVSFDAVQHSCEGKQCKLKVAIVVSGDMRNFLEPERGAETMKKFLLDGPYSYDMDVYVCVRDDHNITFTQHVLQSMLGMSKVHVFGFQASNQFERLAICYSLIVETHSADYYDWFIRTRPDNIYFDNPIPFLETLNPGQVHVRWRLAGPGSYLEEEMSFYVPKIVCGNRNCYIADDQVGIVHGSLAAKYFRASILCRQSSLGCSLSWGNGPYIPPSCAGCCLEWGFTSDLLSQNLTLHAVPIRIRLFKIKSVCSGVLTVMEEPCFPPRPYNQSRTQRLQCDERL